MSKIPSRSTEALLHAFTIENPDGSLSIDIGGETGKVRPKTIDDSKKFLRKLLKENSDGTFSLRTNLGVNLTLENRTTDPDSPQEGQMYWNPSTNELKIYDGASFIVLGGGLSAAFLTWVNSLDKLIQFTPTAYSDSAGSTQTITLAMTNAHGDVNTFNSTDSVTVSLTTPGSATLLTAQPVTFASGVVTVQVSDAAQETVVLGLSSPSKAVNVADIANVTFT